MRTPLIHSQALHVHYFRNITRVIPVNQPVFPSDIHSGRKFPIPELLIRCLSSAGNNFQQKQPGTFVCQINFHGTVKGRLGIRNHRLWIIIKNSVFLHLSLYVTDSLSFFHLMNLIKRLGQKFHVCTFCHRKIKLLSVSFHNPRRSTQWHYRDSSVFLWKGIHNLIRCGKSNIFYYRLSIS